MAGDEVSEGRRESGPSALPRLTGSWTNPTAHPKNEQRREALAEVLVTRPFGTGPTTRLKNRVSGNPDLRATHISYSVDPQYSSHPDV